VFGVIAQLIGDIHHSVYVVLASYIENVLADQNLRMAEQN